MIRFYPLIFVLFFLSACKQEYREVCERYPSGVIKSELIYPDKSDTSNYSINRYYPTGKVEFKSEIKDNKFVGEKIEYYESGLVQQIDSLTEPCNLDTPNCNCDEKITKFNSLGIINQTYVGKGGKLNGILNNYDSSGKLVYIDYYVNDKKNGKQTSYYPNGKKYCVVTFKNDSIVGYAYFFKQNGDTLKYYNTNHGEPDCPYKKWLDNGLVLTGEYTSNKRNEILYVWIDKSGKEIKRHTSEPMNGRFILPD